VATKQGIRAHDGKQNPAPDKNVFRELGFDVEESENPRIRADLMIGLTELIER